MIPARKESRGFLLVSILIETQNMFERKRGRRSVPHQTINDGSFSFIEICRTHDPFIESLVDLFSFTIIIYSFNGHKKPDRPLFVQRKPELLPEHEPWLLASFDAVMDEPRSLQHMVNCLRL